MPTTQDFPPNPTVPAKTGDAQTSSAQTGETQTGETQTGETQTGETQTSDTQTSDTQTSDTQTSSALSSATQAAAAEVLARCRELARITDVPGETTRTFLSPATHAAHALVSAWMRSAGLTVTIDPIGNLHGLSANADANTPRLLLGSHLDTVPDAGAFDGALGIVLAIAFADALRNQQLPFALEIIAFSEEEGVRFRQPFLGSLALVGEPVADTVSDANGITLTQAVRDYGHTPTSPPLLSPLTFAYFECHIEQGPVLEAEGRPLAAVSAIAGQTRARIIFQGHANHAGTTPMALRHDALAAAAAWIVAVESYALATAGLVATVGSIEARPGLGNVIAHQVTVSLDLRHAHDTIRHTAFAELTRTAEQIARDRALATVLTPVLDQAAVAMDPVLTTALVNAAGTHGHNAAAITSGAGHDAMILARRVPCAMLFLRTPGGLSHHPGESVSIDDVAAALATALTFLRDLAPGGAPADASAQRIDYA